MKPIETKNACPALAAATERAEKAERERDSLQRDFDAVTAEMNGQDLGEILAKARMK
jgi:hypothetical protein